MIRIVVLASLLLLAASIAVAAPIKDGRSAITIDAQWLDRSVKLYVSGDDAATVGIWNRTTQFTLDAKTTKSILAQFDQIRFDSMPDGFGGIPKSGRGQRSLRPERLIGSVSRTVDSKTKSSSQLAEGVQSELLAELAKFILDPCEAAAKTGITAKSLDDALKLFNAGKIAPVCLSILVHRLPEGKNAGNDDSFLFRLEGRVIQTQPKTAKGYGDPYRLELNEAELNELARALITADVGGFPVNLWAPHYTDLVVTVLGYEKNLQARQFAQMSPTTHGDKQKRFDALFAKLLKLHRRAVKDGTIQKPKE